MKTLSFFLIPMAALVALSCNPTQSDQTAGSDTTSTAAPETKAAQINIILWSEVGVHATPEEKGKYVTSVYLGEHVDITGDTASEVSGKKRNHYHKVTLADGNTGWVRDEFLAIDVQPAAVVGEAPIYKRPDIATITEKSFVISDFVVVRKTEGDFVEITGKIAGDKWFTTGFVPATAISYAPIEIQYAALKRRAGDESKEKVKNALMTQLASYETFSGSVLWNNDYAVEEEEEGSDMGDGYGEDPNEAVDSTASENP